MLTHSLSLRARWSLMAVAAFAASTASAQVVQISQPQTLTPGVDLARVISSTPILSQTAVPKQVCTTQPVSYTRETQVSRNDDNSMHNGGSGAGAVVGGLLGAVIGNQIGKGSGRAAATAGGLIGGAILGSQIGKSDGADKRSTVQTTDVRNVQNCTTQNMYESKTIGYNVVYEYAGKQYSAQFVNDPGQWVQVQLSPVGAQPYTGSAQPITRVAPQASLGNGEVIIQDAAPVQPTVIVKEVVVREPARVVYVDRHVPQVVTQVVYARPRVVHVPAPQVVHVHPQPAYHHPGHPPSHRDGHRNRHHGNAAPVTHVVHHAPAPVAHPVVHPVIHPVQPVVHTPQPVHQPQPRPNRFNREAEFVVPSGIPAHALKAM
jgi:uncharacterized protein YcfJ